MAAATDLARFTGRRRVVVATADAITARMAGPAIRAWRVASELALDHEVRLVSITVAELSDPSFSVEAVRSAEIDDLIDWCDVCVFQGWVMAGRKAFHRSDKVFVADIYDPMHLEQLEQARDGGEKERRRAVRDATAVLNEQLLRGDFFLCASTKQRDLWLGHLTSLGRVNPATYDADPSLERPHHRGARSACPTTRRCAPGPRIKGVIPGIGADDTVILWGGGVYNWFDPADPDPGGRPPARRAARRAPGVPRDAPPQRRHPRDAHGRRGPGAWPTSWGSPVATCSSTRDGCPTTSARTTCSTPTWR